MEVDVTMGNVEIVVPPGFEVDVQASSVLGAIEERTRPASGAGGTAMIRVVGRVRLGHLGVSDRAPRGAFARRRARFADAG